MHKDLQSVINVAEAKKRFSELLNEVVYHKKKFLIGRRGAPMIGIVPADEIQLSNTPLKNGFLSLVGLWEDVKNMDSVVQDIYKKRAKESRRPVPSLADE